MKYWRQIPFELIFWIAALVLLSWEATVETGNDIHLTICPLASLGFHWCPGCGIGRSLGYLLHGEVVKSIAYHWFGIPAIMIIFHRIFALVRMMYRSRREIIVKRRERNYV